MISKKYWESGCKKYQFQKTCKIFIVLDSINIDFLVANRQFDRLEMLLVYDKRDKHTTIYHSYAELAAKYIKRVKLENITKIYSLTNELYTASSFI